MHPALRKEPLFYKKTLPVFHFFFTKKPFPTFLQKNTPHFSLFFYKTPPFSTFLQKHPPPFHFCLWACPNSNIVFINLTRTLNPNP